MKKAVNCLLTFALVIASLFAFSFNLSAKGEKWVASWGCAPVKASTEVVGELVDYIGSVTARTSIKPTASGAKVRFLLSNRYGDYSVTIKSMTVARSSGGGKIIEGSVSPVTFGGKFSVTIPAGVEIYSDEIIFGVTSSDEIAVSMFFDKFKTINTYGITGAKTYLGIGEKDLTKEEGLLNFDSNIANSILSSLLGGNGIPVNYNDFSLIPCLAGMDVLSDSGAYSVAVLGDSTIANDFSSLLFQKLRTSGKDNIGVINKGLVGNKLLSDGLGNTLVDAKSILSRLDTDVLEQSGVEYVILKCGMNDITEPVSKNNYGNTYQPSAKDLIDGYKALFDACHKKGIKVIAVGITQWKGNKREFLGQDASYLRSGAEFEDDWEIALKVNDWLQTSKDHDGYVSFNDISQSDKDSSSMDPNYTTDGLHPTAELQQLWVNYFPESLIGVGKKVAGVLLDTSAVSLNSGASRYLKATIMPESAENKNLIWTSSNPEVASVNTSGKVTALKNGTAVISCTSEEGGFKVTCTVTVKTKASGITLSKTSVSLYTTKSYSVSATVLPAEASDKSVAFKSSDTSVAKVSSKGKITAVGAGTATITATNSAGQSASCTVKVKKKVQVTGIDFNRSTLAVYVGRTYQITPQIYPSNATFKDVQWVSSDPTIATVSESGLVKGIKNGKVKITCKSVDNPMVTQSLTLTVAVKATKLALSNTAITVYTTTSKTLTPKFTPSNSTYKDVSWDSENTKIATVDKNGVVKGRKVGTTYITCTSDRYGYTATCKVTVKQGVLSKKITLNKTAISLADGKSYTLKPTFSPSNTTTKACLWSSSNTKVAKVTSSGVVKAVAPGKATITCKAKDSGKYATCTVTVKAVIPTAVTFSSEYYNVDLGKTLKLTASVSPSNSTNKTLIFKSSDPSAVSISSSGVVKGLKKGKTVTITVTTKSGNRVDKCKVHVGNINVTGVKLNKSSLTVSIADTASLTATITPSTATNKKLIWTSDNENVAIVSSTGVVTGISKGETLIYCTTDDGGYFAICKVKVTV